MGWLFGCLFHYSFPSSSVHRPALYFFYISRARLHALQSLSQKPISPHMQGPAQSIERALLPTSRSSNFHVPWTALHSFQRGCTGLAASEKNWKEKGRSGQLSRGKDKGNIAMTNESMRNGRRASFFSPDTIASFHEHDCESIHHCYIAVSTGRSQTGFQGKYRRHCRCG